jgi:endonuclease/exonuclease/phosphatase family metal-dependent hydrolase
LSRTFLRIPTPALLLLILLLRPLPLQAYHPGIGSFNREDPQAIRLLTYNLERKFLVGTADENAAFDRLILATQPDVLALQEVADATTPTDLTTRMEQLLGGAWFANTGRSDGFIKNAVVSRYPFLDEGDDSIPPSELRALTWAHIDLPNSTYPTDLYVISVHFKASSGASNDARRQITADAAANWIADLTRPGGQTTLPANTPILITGDFNIRDTFSQQPWLTLLSGDIQNEDTYGPDRPGDWDGTPLAEFLPRNPYNHSFLTHPSNGTLPTARLDRFAYTDSALRILQGFILSDSTMTTSQRTAFGLNPGDTLVSDHLPFVVDLLPAALPITVPEYGDLIVSEIMADPTLVADSAGEWVELFNPRETTFDLTGTSFITSTSSTASGYSIDFLTAIEGEFALPSGAYALLGKQASPSTNGGIQPDALIPVNALANAGDSVELWRGSIKLDGARYGNGSLGEGTPNVLWSASAATPGFSLEQKGDLTQAPTGQYDLAELLYNIQDRGTPRNRFQTPQQPVPSAIWFLF